VQPINPPVDLVILQHPSEVGHSKGTAWLAHKCIPGSQLFIGDNLAELTELQAWLNQGRVYLLYPCEPNQACQAIEARVLREQSVSEQDKIKILVLDGTWRKTYRLLQMNPSLADLPRVGLSHSYQSSYVIRKSKREDSLSTLEAIYQFMVEYDSAGNYQNLLQGFAGLMAIHKYFRPKP
jgi:DTW domain-containing protein YfiP